MVSYLNNFNGIISMQMSYPRWVRNFYAEVTIGRKLDRSKGNFLKIVGRGTKEEECHLKPCEWGPTLH